MVFGSIDVTSSESNNIGQSVRKETEDEKEKEKKKPFTIAIGVDSGVGVPARVRTVQKKSVGNGKPTGGSSAEKEKDSKKDEKDRKKTKDGGRIFRPCVRPPEGRSYLEKWQK